LAFLVLTSGYAVAGDLEEYAAFENARLAPLQAAHAKVLETYRTDPAVVAYGQRLDLLGDAISQIVREFTRAKFASLDVLVDDDPLSPPKPSPRKMPTTFGAAGDFVMDGAAIFDRYQADFAQPLPPGSLDAKDLKVLRDYYAARVAAANEFIAQRARPLASLKSGQAGIVEVCLVMGLLHVSDDAWAAADTASLATWLHNPDHLARLESFALRCRRPLTAWNLACERASLGKQSAPERSEYLRSTGEAAASRREYHAAIQCYRTGIQQATSANQTQQAMALRLTLAELLSKLGHAQLASQEVRSGLDACGDYADYGKATVLWLKYLYEGGQFEPILAVCNPSLKDKRCDRYQPQIVYIAWVSARRLNHTDRAKKLQDQFVAAWPQHALCADMYFAAAMSRLAEGKYDEAGKLLEIVETRFPKSPLAPKVRDIRARLDKTASRPGHV
jgi:tetratricopeptide (TPR) repeat protein